MITSPMVFILSPVAAESKNLKVRYKNHGFCVRTFQDEHDFLSALDFKKPPAALIIIDSTKSLEILECLKLDIPFIQVFTEDYEDLTKVKQFYKSGARDVKPTYMVDRPVVAMTSLIRRKISAMVTA